MLVCAHTSASPLLAFSVPLRVSLLYASTSLQPLSSVYNADFFIGPPKKPRFSRGGPGLLAPSRVNGRQRLFVFALCLGSLLLISFIFFTRPLFPPSTPPLREERQQSFLFVCATLSSFLALSPSSSLSPFPATPVGGLIYSLHLSATPSLPIFRFPFFFLCLFGASLLVATSLAIDRGEGRCC